MQAPSLAESLLGVLCECHLSSSGGGTVGTDTTNGCSSGGGADGTGVGVGVGGGGGGGLMLSYPPPAVVNKRGR